MVPRYAARCRLGECAWKTAWSLIVESAVRQVKATIADYLEENSEDGEAKALQAKLAHLQKHIPFMKGMPDVEDPMQAYISMENIFKSGEWDAVPLEERARPVEFTNGVGYLSRELKVSR